MSGKTIRLTMAQAAGEISDAADDHAGRWQVVPIFGGVFAIFGHGNVAGIGEALYQVRGELPTYRAHNEQGMAHAAIAYAKASFRRRMMAVTTSIGPGATNLVTACCAGACQPPAGAVVARRCLRQSRTRSGAAAGRGLWRRHGERQ